MRISVVIPTWCEAERIATAVASGKTVGDEVVVADAASPDGTSERAARAGARVVQCSRGRGPQLNAGARASTGDVLLFLHADAQLPARARDAIGAALRDPAIVGGNFRLRFEPSTPIARLFGTADDLRRRWFGIYYGDSAPFVRRRTFDALGGFPALPIFEDYELARRIGRAGRTAYIRDVPVHASARGFASQPLRALWIWTALHAMYSLGVPAARLARFYGVRR